MTSDTKILQRLLDPSLGGTKLELKHGELMHLPTVDLGGPRFSSWWAIRSPTTRMFMISTEYNTVDLEQRIRRQWETKGFLRGYGYDMGIVDDLVTPGRPSPFTAPQLEPSKPAEITYRVSAELVAIVSPPPRWPPAGWITFDSLIPAR